ncbi:MAG: M1 family metallopeptidase [Flavobacteriales bacterium]|nr:M1 family metallopeptidase [Flavobacteriales bacterium]
MKILINSLFFGLLFFCSFSQQENNSSNQIPEKQMPSSIIDSHTLSNYKDISIEHSHLNLSVDFESKLLYGSVTHTINNPTKDSVFILDTKYLSIESVSDQDGNKLDFSYGEKDDLLGDPLMVSINAKTKKVTIKYSTTTQSEALDWLNAEQTAGKEFPFMYTQGQSIFTRSWIPIQDTPGLRITYSADITVPNGMLPVMSAANPQIKNNSNTYSFEMNQPIPPYLIALAVGNLEFKKIDNRTGVYAEPNMLESSVAEFTDMGKMVDAAEELYGKYDWERFDVIVLPPSFPFGGMENPRLTFATPTIIAGDRSLVSLIAHELAHSWSGNLVTNATWNDFWLNEGFTVYFERRIMEALYGKDYTEMLALLGYQDLQEELVTLDPKMQTLKLKMKGMHPDDAMSDIAYEKGYFLLRMIENNVGREAMDSFLKKYFNDHKFQTIVTEEFLAYLEANLIKGKRELLKIDEWVYQPGLPDNCPVIECKRFINVESAIDDFMLTNTIAKLNTTEWSTHEWIHFVKNLPDSVNSNQMMLLDNAFNLSSSGNSEILAVWFERSIVSNYRTAFPFMKEFLVRVGRRKFLQPIYESLAKTEEHKAWAKDVYKEARSNYHYVSFNTIDKILE